MPCENIHDDLPTYQTSALGRFLTARLAERARTRVNERQEQQAHIAGSDGGNSSMTRGRDGNTTTDTGQRRRQQAGGDQPRALPAEPVKSEDSGFLYAAEERERVRRQHRRDSR